MPEGPEIRRAADIIAKIIEGEVIEDIEVGLTHLSAGAKGLIGEKVEGVETRGKAMLIHFSNDTSIYSHNQLYGVWKTAKRGILPHTKRSLRLALHAREHSALLYSASDIGIYQSAELANHPFLKKLGPDVLQASLTWQQVKMQLREKRFSNRSLSALYLDQHFIAGIGNYLRSEILFAAGAHPDDKPRNLTESQIKNLAKQTLIIAKRAYETKGHTVDSSLQKKLGRGGASFENIRFMVFNRENLLCRVCVSPIIKAQRNGRRIYYCEGCQIKAGLNE